MCQKASPLTVTGVTLFTAMERLYLNEGRKQLQMPEIWINLAIYTKTTTGKTKTLLHQLFQQLRPNIGSPLTGVIQEGVTPLQGFNCYLSADERSTNLCGVIYQPK